jgi:hypothetical protein
VLRRAQRATVETTHPCRPAQASISARAARTGHRPACAARRPRPASSA